MKNHYKIIGDLTKTNIEFSLDLSRWLIGFGWIKHSNFKKQKRSVHFNLGPLAIILTIL